MKKTNYLSIVALVLSIIAIAMCSICCLNKDKAVAAALEKNPGMVIDALQRYEQQARDEQFSALRAVIAENIKEINNSETSPFIGPKDAKVVLAVFYDYSCGYCHRLHPVLVDIMNKNPDVKFVFKPLTFLGPISEYAAKAVIAANLQGKFQIFDEALFSYQGQLTEEKIDEIAAKVGLDVEQLKADMESEKVLSTLTDISSLATRIQISGVPTMILDGGVLQTFDPVEIQKGIDAAKKR